MTVFYWITQNTKPDFVTPQITGTPFLHAYYKKSFHNSSLMTLPLLLVFTQRQIQI